jgi:hypothetical protein
MSLKAKFSWGDNRLVVPIRHLKQEKVVRLLNDVYERFSREFGLSPDNRFITIRTADGYTLNLNDVVEDVVTDGECFVLVDYGSWMKEHTGHCNKDWLCVDQLDLVDEVSKWAGVGVHAKSGSLYIRLAKGNSVSRLELITRDELTHMAKPGKHLASQLSGTKDGLGWSVDAYLVVEGQTVTAVELGVKTMSSPTAVVKRVEVKRDEDGKLIAGEITTVSNPTLHVYKSPNPRLPQNHAQGPVFTVLPVLPDAALVASTGDSPVSLKQTEKIFVQQQWARDDKVPHYIYTEVLVSNNTDKKVNFVKLQAEYKNAAGEWVDTKGWVGYKYGNFDYRSYNADVVPVEESSSEKLVLAMEIAVPGKQYDRERRVQQTLPQPLHLRYTWTDSENKSAVLETTYVNPPHDLPSKERISKRENKTIVDWAECDDPAAETKIFAYSYLNEDGTEYNVRLANTSSTLSNEYFRRMCWRAARENKSEIEVNSWESQGTWSTLVNLLVDLEHKQVRGLKVSLKTSTSTAEYFWPCPELNEKEN